MKFVQSVFKDQLAEIGQQLNIRVAFVVQRKDGHYTNAHPFVKCRDFLGDTLYALETKQSFSIYGFKFNPKVQSIYSKYTRFVWEFPNKEAFINFKTQLHRVNDYEKVNKLRKTTFKIVKTDKKKIYVITTGSNFWKKSVFNISLYTFLLKSLGYKLDPQLSLLAAIEQTTVQYTTWDGTVQQRRTNEADYASKAGAKLHTVLVKLRAVNKNLPSVIGTKDEYTTHNVHYHCGFVATITETYYYENKLKDNLKTL